jgi:hypothetical protein
VVSFPSAEYSAVNVPAMLSVTEVRKPRGSAVRL